MTEPAGEVRDGQRARVYAGEHVVHGLFDRSGTAPTVQIAGSTVTVPVERRFGDLAGVQRYVDAVLALAWVRAEFPRASVPVTVRARRGATKAHYERAGAVIAVPTPGGIGSAGGSRAGPTWALRELVVLHELAHHLDPDPAGPADASGGSRVGPPGPADAPDGSPGPADAPVGPPGPADAPGGSRDGPPGWPRGPAEGPHGPAFVGRLRRLIGELVGPEAAWLLTVAWADQGVRG